MYDNFMEVEDTDDEEELEIANFKSILIHQMESSDGYKMKPHIPDEWVLHL